MTHARDWRDRGGLWYDQALSRLAARHLERRQAHFGVMVHDVCGILRE